MYDLRIQDLQTFRCVKHVLLTQSNLIQVTLRKHSYTNLYSFSCVNASQCISQCIVFMCMSVTAVVSDHLRIAEFVHKSSLGGKRHCKKSVMYRVSGRTALAPPSPTKHACLPLGPARISELSTRKSQRLQRSLPVALTQKKKKTTKHGLHHGLREGKKRRSVYRSRGAGLK